MASPLVRLLNCDGVPVFIHPNRVTGIIPAAERLDANGATPRSVVFVGMPHVCSGAKVPGQLWDTMACVVLGSPDDIAARLWPAEAAQP